jgi:hypothetical protein
VWGVGSNVADAAVLVEEVPPPLPLSLYDALAVHRALPPTDHFLSYVAPRCVGREQHERRGVEQHERRGNTSEEGWSNTSEEGWSNTSEEGWGNTSEEG